ncbi:unnamed protein product [Trichogramma brassicae]|uniref:Uncharacterized protein n=1 Tax=Trichogramma brassicae TaxID=86971 RepID=A0A6H5IU13_9HYME|nr:unnamed protein product [Trichogramma brassicae]
MKLKLNISWYSATLTKCHVQWILRNFHFIRNIEISHNDGHRDNLFIKVDASKDIHNRYANTETNQPQGSTLKKHEVAYVVSLLKSNLYEGKTAIVYAYRASTVEQLSFALTCDGLSNVAYTGVTRSSMRRPILMGWLRGDVKIVVATSAFGLGIDHPNIRLIIIYELPESVAALTQMMGRAGHDRVESGIHCKETIRRLEQVYVSDCVLRCEQEAQSILHAQSQQRNNTHQASRNESQPSGGSQNPQSRFQHSPNAPPQMPYTAPAQIQRACSRLSSQYPHSRQPSTRNRSNFYAISWTTTTRYLQPGEGTSGALNKICLPWAPTRSDEEPSCESNDFLDMQIDFEEFNVALEDKKDSASPGMDDLFNEMIKLGEFPHSWRDVFVHFIKKPDGKNYRTISLTSCTCKLLETIIKNRLQWWAETNNWLPLCQHGFRKGNSCIDNLAGLTMTVQSAFKERRDVYATFLDIEGAFDNVNIDILIQRLVDLGTSLSSIRFIKFITAERHIFTSKHKSSHLVSYKGLPQGAVLSPLLYAIYTASLTSNLPENVSASCFTDDKALYIKSDPHSSSIQTLEKAIKILDQNITNLGLSIAPHKSKFLHFSRTTKSSKQQIKIKSHMLSAQSSVKFLGITFDPRLDFNLQDNHFNPYAYSYQATYYKPNVDLCLGDKLKNADNWRELFDEYLQKHDTAVDIYTDGSKITGLSRAGAAIFCPKSHHSKTIGLENHCSIFTAECTAIIEAIDHCLEYPNCDYIIFTDSLSALHSLASNTLSVKTSYLISKIKTIYAEFVSSNPTKYLKFVWIPSHIGIPENEAVDALAKSAIASADRLSIQVPFTDFFQGFSEATRESSEQTNEREGLEKGTKFFSLYRTTSRNPRYHKKKLPRSFIVTINRIRSNHHGLAESLYRKNIIADKTCKCGHFEEELNHVLWSCELYRTQRRKLLDKLRLLGHPPPLNVESLIARPNIEACWVLCQFFWECGLNV